LVVTFGGLLNALDGVAASEGRYVKLIFHNDLEEADWRLEDQI
jgi:hypothetical protein